MGMGQLDPCYEGGVDFSAPPSVIGKGRRLCLDISFDE